MRKAITSEDPVECRDMSSQRMRDSVGVCIVAGLGIVAVSVALLLWYEIVLDPLEIVARLCH